jgi:hypothetical protein
VADTYGDAEIQAHRARFATEPLCVRRIVFVITRFGCSEDNDRRHQTPWLQISSIAVGDPLPWDVERMFVCP